MTVEPITTRAPLYAWRDQVGAIRIEGSRAALKYFAGLLRDYDALPKDLSLGSPPVEHPASRNELLDSLLVYPSASKVVVKKEGNAVSIRGTKEDLDILAHNILHVAESEGTELGVQRHTDIDYYPDHEYLDSESEPLTVLLQ